MPPAPLRLRTAQQSRRSFGTSFARHACVSDSVALLGLAGSRPCALQPRAALRVRLRPWALLLPRAGPLTKALIMGKGWQNYSMYSSHT